MPCAITAPVETPRHNNPADELLDMVQGNGKPEPLGATRVFCNGKNISNLEVNPEVKIQKQSNQYRLTGVQAENYTFTFTIELPPRPTPTNIPLVPIGWVSRIVRLTDLEKVVAKVNRIQGFTIPPGLKNATGRIILSPKPTPDAMWNHIRNHERQHVADVRWIIQRTFEPWVRWVDSLAQNSGNKIYTAKEKSTLDWFVGGGVQPNYIGQYVFTVANELSEEYHKSDAGAAPIYTATKMLRVGSLEMNDVALIVEVKPKVVIANMTWNSAPHRYPALDTVQTLAAGVSTTVIKHSNVAPNWELPTIALEQSHIDKYEEEQAPSEDSSMGSFWNS